MYKYLIALFLIVASALTAIEYGEELKQVPVAYKGRFRPLDANARQWLYDWYHQEQIKSSDRPLFYLDVSANDLIWDLHFRGHQVYADSPLFWVPNKELKSLLGLDPNQQRFSYRELQHVINEESANSDKQLTEDRLNLRNRLAEFAQMNGPTLRDDVQLQLVLEQALQQGMKPQEIAQYLESQLPLYQRLVRTDSLLKLLPSKRQNGEWLPIKALKAKIYDAQNQQLVPVGNFTLYSNEQFQNIQQTYLLLERAALNQDQSQVLVLAKELSSNLVFAYTALAGTPVIEALGKSLYYPSLWQLRAEKFYYQYPLVSIAVTLYALSAALLLLGVAFNKLPLQRMGKISLLLSLIFHSFIIGLRCYILERPPVSNMFETVIYVPWIAVSAGFIFYWFLRNIWILIGSAVVAVILFFVLQLTHLNAGLENVQAVLDSQYWLLIHVLMVVGSYGAFVLSGVLGHFYLIARIYTDNEQTKKMLSNAVLQTLYLGVALLVPGTILGGVWAAESWGRFWIGIRKSPGLSSQFASI